MSALLGDNEINRLLAVNRALLNACQHALAAIDMYPERAHPMTASEVIMRDAVRAAEDPRWAYCPRCEAVVRTIDDGETCASCKLVL